MATWKVSFEPVIVEADDEDEAALIGFGEAHDGALEVGRVDLWRG